MDKYLGASFIGAVFFGGLFLFASMALQKSLEVLKKGDRSVYNIVAEQYKGIMVIAFFVTNVFSITLGYLTRSIINL